MHEVNTEYARELGRLYDKYGMLVPEVIVNEAESPLSPLHDAFEWDNERAGHGFRIQQARLLIRKVNIIHVGSQEARKVYNVKVTTVNEKTAEPVSLQGYIDEKKVKDNPQLLRQIKQNALDMIAYWREKYEKIDSLGKIVNTKEVSRLQEELSTVAEEPITLGKQSSTRDASLEVVTN